MAAVIVGTGIDAAVEARTNKLLSHWCVYLANRAESEASVKDVVDRIKKIAQAQLTIERYQRKMRNKLDVLMETPVNCVIPHETISAMDPHMNSKDRYLFFCITPTADKVVFVAAQSFIFYFVNPSGVIGSETRSFPLSDLLVVDPITGNEYYALKDIDYTSLGFVQVESKLMAPEYRDYLPFERQACEIETICYPPRSLDDI